MCQLLGLSCNQEIQPGPYLRTLLSRSPLHPDGWGLACYLSNCNGATIFKEPIKGADSHLANFLCNYSELKSKIFIGHIRKATKGSVDIDNTHPFNRIYSGRNFSFAHNGTLSKRKRLTRLAYQPLGTTDSERAFCFLLSQMRRHEIKPVRADGVEMYDVMQFQCIYEILLDINTIAAGSFNCMFSDGKYLFCYRDHEEARYLFYQRSHGDSDKTTTVKNFTAQNSHMEISQTAKGYLIATEPINDGEWQSFTGGQLIVFRDGEIIVNIS